MSRLFGSGDEVNSASEKESGRACVDDLGRLCMGNGHRTAKELQ